MKLEQKTDTRSSDADFQIKADEPQDGAATLEAKPMVSIEAIIEKPCTQSEVEEMSNKLWRDAMNAVLQDLRRGSQEWVDLQKLHRMGRRDFYEMLQTMAVKTWETPMLIQMKRALRR